MLIFLFLLLFLKIFKQGYYIYYGVRGLISSTLMTAVVMAVQLRLTLKLLRFAGKPCAAKFYSLNIWQFQCFDESQRCLELLRIRFLNDLGNLHLKTLLWKVWPQHSLLYSNETRKGLLTVMHHSNECMCKPVIYFFSGLKWQTNWNIGR